MKTLKLDTELTGTNIVAADPGIKGAIYDGENFYNTDVNSMSKIVYQRDAVLVIEAQHFKMNAQSAIKIAFNAGMIRQAFCYIEDKHVFSVQPQTWQSWLKTVTQLQRSEYKTASKWYLDAYNKHTGQSTKKDGEAAAFWMYHFTKEKIYGPGMYKNLMIDKWKV